MAFSCLERWVCKQLNRTSHMCSTTELHSQTLRFLEKENKKQTDSVGFI